MRLEIENIGPIRKKQELIIDGITILAGENGCGKSTFGKVLFCLFSAFYNIEEQIDREKKYAVRRMIVKEMKPRRRIANNRSINEEELEEKLFQNLPQDVTEEEIGLQLASLFGEEIDSEKFGGLSGRILKAWNMEDNVIAERLLGYRIESEFDSQLRNINAGEELAEAALNFKDGTIRFQSKGEVIKVNEYISLTKEILYIDEPNVLDSLGAIYYFQPDEYNTHKQEIVSKLRNSKRRFTSVEQLLMDDRIRRIMSQINTVCDGEVVRSEGLGYRYVAKEYLEGLSFGNMATSLKAFAILKTMLQKGYLEENGTVIFDEPEIHLHPEWQRIFAELIVLLNKELGINVLLSTHSSDFLGFMELYMKKYDVMSTSKIYQLRKNAAGESELVDATGNIELIYRQLGRPFLRATEELEHLNESQ